MVTSEPGIGSLRVLDIVRVKLRMLGTRGNGFSLRVLDIVRVKLRMLGTRGNGYRIDSVMD